MPRSLFPAASPDMRARLEQDPTLKLVNDFAWDATPLGPIPQWPETLKGAVRVMMAASTPMVMLIGPDGILVYNHAYAEFAGERHPSIMGQGALEAWPEIADFNRHKIELGLRGQSLILRNQELALNRRGHVETGWMDLHYSPLLGDDGAPLGSLCMVYETTDRVMAETALARSEERLSLALNGSSLVGTWDWNLITDTITADDKFAQLFGIDPLRAGLGLSSQDFLGSVHPDDVAAMSLALREAIREGALFRKEFRLLDANGGVQWVIGSGRPRLDQQGKAHRLPGVLIDVTEQHQIADALAESEQRFRTLADSMPQMVWSTHPDGTFDYFNARWSEFTGLPPGTGDGTFPPELIHPDDRPRTLDAFRQALAAGEPYQDEHRLLHHSGEFRWTLARAMPLRDAQGQIVRWIGTSTDIHQSKLAAEERDLVSQELSHRIKNIFAVLTGIISLSARSHPESKPFADELRQRIYALGEAHDFVRPRPSGAAAANRQNSLQALVQRLMQPYGSADQRRVQFLGDDAEIDDGAATPLALLFHELATNAAKYGALSAAGGTVILTGQAGDQRYHLDWKERGGPGINYTGEAPGFGSRVIQLSVEGQLHGRLERFWESDGLRIEIDLPGHALRRSARLQEA